VERPRIVLQARGGWSSRGGARRRLADINREQVLLVRLEWRIVHAGMDAARSYVENVVLPAIRRAERAAVG